MQSFILPKKRTYYWAYYYRLWYDKIICSRL